MPMKICEILCKIGEMEEARRRDEQQRRECQALRTMENLRELGLYE